MTLHTFTAEARALNDFLDYVADAEGEATEDDERAALQWLRDHEADRDRKIEAVAFVVREKEAHVNAIKDEEARLAARRQSEERDIDRLKKSVLAYFAEAGIDKVKTPLFTVSRRGNGGKAPLKVLDGLDLGAVPEAFLRFPDPELDKEAVRAALEAGEALDWAEIGERGSHCSIR